MRIPRIYVSLLVICISVAVSLANIQAYNHPAILSFEDGISPAKADTYSELTVDGKHFKHGKNSLKWQWNQNQASWNIQEEIPYAYQNPFGNNSVSTFVFWVYSPEKLKESKLIFSFYKNGKLCSWFDYKLGFKGWSGAWIAFDRDMQGKAVEGMDELRVTIEGAPTGRLYFDHIMLSSFQDVRQHTPDFQAPFVNAGTTNHWLILLDSWEKKFDIQTKDEISSKEIADMQLIEDRFVSILLNGRKTFKLQNLINRYNEYQVQFQEDGSISGLPIFFERYGETYEYLGAPRYGLIFGNAMGLSHINKLMFDMAVTYRKSNDIAEKKQISEMFINLTRHMIDQGFRAGSAMGTLHHLGYSIRMYYPAAFLMRNLLRDNHLDAEIQQAMEWFSAAGEIKTKAEAPGMDVDAFNTTLTGRLATILMMKDSPEKIRYMQAFKRWIDNGLQYADGTQGTFKIDGSMFHHRHNYPAYAVGGLEGAVNITWILHQTNFALNSSGREILKQGLLAMRYYCNLNTWPLSLSGRHPDGLGHLYPHHFAQLAVAGSPDEKDEIDKDLAAAYLRLIGDSITQFSSLFKDAGVQAEQSLDGNRTFPYSSLSIHRRNNWMVSAMGHSRYLWATETYVGANHYGRYLNHGHLQIMATGNPISNFGSGFKQEGWDWNHFPGTTAADLPIKDLKSDVRNLDADSGYEEMLLSDEAFAGGISILNKNGIYAMKLHEHDKYNGSLRAHKSFFFFDNRVIAIGSNIRSALPENEVHTTLFQVYQPAQIHAVSLNKKSFMQTDMNKKVKQNCLHKVVESSDGLNNYFFVRKGDVHLKRSIQHSFHEETDEPTQNPFSLAYINHGKMAQKDSYEYMVLIQPEQEDLKTIRKTISSAKKSPYTVLQQDSMAHIVYDKATQTTAYVFFEAGAYTDEKRSIAVNQPCLVMTDNSKTEGLHLSIADPDLRFYEGPSDEEYDESGKRIERSVYSRDWLTNPSKSSNIEITLGGNWQLAKPSAFFSIKSSSLQKTILEVSCQHGLSREVALINIEQ